MSFYRARCSAVMLLSGVLFFSSPHAETMLNLKMGPTYAANSNNDYDRLNGWHGHAELGLGICFDRIVGIGAEIDFMWNTDTRDSTHEITDLGPEYITVNDTVDKRFMFPLSIFLVIDPIGQYRLHPVLKGTFGFNMMARSCRVYDLDTNNDVIERRSGKNGFYYGMTATVAGDALFDLTEMVALFAGLEYQWANARKKKKNTVNQYYQENLHAFAIRAGFRFFF